MMEISRLPGRAATHMHGDVLYPPVRYLSTRMVMEVEAAAIQKHMVMVLHAMEWWWSLGLDRWIRSASIG
jgi:hypothetical protein